MESSAGWLPEHHKEAYEFQFGSKISLLTVTSTVTVNTFDFRDKNEATDY
jgi:hypothetical protein